MPLLKPKVYLETTIPSLLTAWPNRDVIVAGQQQITRQWWEERRQGYDLFVSVIVMKEAQRGDPQAIIERTRALQECRILPFPPEAEDLTRALMLGGLIPVNAEADAAHIATAAVHGMNFLLTWNCRHIANATIVDKLRDVCEREGFAAPIICTPHQLMI